MADRFFVGDVDSDWDDGSNWAASSGGAGGAGVPGGSDRAIFDINSPDCVCDVKPNIDELLLEGTSGSAFANKLDLSTFGMTVNSIVVEDGELDMGSGKVDINTTTAGEGFFQSGGTVTLTSGTCECNSDFERSAGTLNHNSGTLFMNRVIAADRDLNVNGAELYNLTVTYGAYSVDWDSDVTIWGKLLINSMRGFEGSSVVTLHGDLETNSTSTVYGTACRIDVVGTGDQEIKSTSGLRKIKASMKIDKPSGTLSFVGNLDFWCNTNRVEYVQGNIDWSVSTGIRFSGHNSYVRATATFEIDAPVTITSGAFGIYWENGDIILNGNYTITSAGNQYSTGGGRCLLRGATNSFNYAIGAYPGTALYVIDGDGDQVLQGTGSITRTQINKTSGVLTFSGTLRFEADSAAQPVLEYIAGDVVTTGSTVQLGAGSHRQNQIKSGAMVLNNLTLNPNGGYTITVDGPCIVAGKLLISTIYTLNRTNGGYLDVHGDLESNDSAFTGNCPINLRGNADQTVLCDGGDLPNADLTINKTGGKAVLGEDFAPPSWTGDFQVTQGALDLAGFDVNIGSQDLNVDDELMLHGTETITGNLNIDDTISKVTFHGAGTAVVQNYATSFFDFSMERGKTISWTAGAPNEVTIKGTWCICGTGSSQVTLRSTADGSQWYLNLEGAAVLGPNVDVKDSNADSGKLVRAPGSTDTGNNDNWDFEVDPGGRGFNEFRPMSLRGKGLSPNKLR